MTDKRDAERAEADANIEREIRNSRKFTLAEAIGRLAGPGALKGESPIARKQQADHEIEACLRQLLPDSVGALQAVLFRHVKESELLHANCDQPLAVLCAYCQEVLSSDYRLKELVREADTEWGRILGERPHFEQEGKPPHPDDCYTVASVHNALSELIKQLSADA